MRVTIVALLPPSNIEQLIIDLQQRLFSEYGIISALALPVIAPLRILDASAEQAEIQHVLEDYDRAFPVGSDSFLPTKTGLFLKAGFDHEGERLWRGLLKALSPFPASGSEIANSLLPPVPAFFICLDESKSLKDIIRSLGPPPEFRFTSFHYGVVAVSAVAEQWWKQVYWEITAEVRAKKGRPPPNEP